jgi:hypothetical protein
MLLNIGCSRGFKITTRTVCSQRTGGLDEDALHTANFFLSFVPVVVPHTRLAEDINEFVMIRY